NPYLSATFKALIFEGFFVSDIRNLPSCDFTDILSTKIPIRPKSASAEALLAQYSIVLNE
ncbi:hypothetical protein, partial [Pseudoalteromonas piscicida]|uniref:hypothetical protein n=1 Tax=Pseudoalteromonas piscicida TaxID=43662 RepID=UPI00127844AC